MSRGIPSALAPGIPPYLGKAGTAARDGALVRLGPLVHQLMPLEVRRGGEAQRAAFVRARQGLVAHVRSEMSLRRTTPDDARVAVRLA